MLARSINICHRLGFLFVLGIWLFPARPESTSFANIRFIFRDFASGDLASFRPGARQSVDDNIKTSLDVARERTARIHS